MIFLTVDRKGCIRKDGEESFFPRSVFSHGAASHGPPGVGAGSSALIHQLLLDLSYTRTSCVILEVCFPQEGFS